MRNVLVHGYFAIDRDVIWNTVQQDIPSLKLAVEALLKRLEAGWGSEGIKTEDHLPRTHCNRENSTDVE